MAHQDRPHRDRHPAAVRERVRRAVVVAGRRPATNLPRSRSAGSLSAFTRKPCVFSLLFWFFSASRQQRPRGRSADGAPSVDPTLAAETSANRRQKRTLSRFRRPMWPRPRPPPDAPIAGGLPANTGSRSSGGCFTQVFFADASAGLPNRASRHPGGPPFSSRARRPRRGRSAFCGDRWRRSRHGTAPPRRVPPRRAWLSDKGSHHGHDDADVQQARRPSDRRLEPDVG